MDLVIGAGLTVAQLSYLDVLNPAGTVALCASVFVVHVAAWMAFLAVAWTPLRSWEHRRSNPSLKPDDALVLEADLVAEQLPGRMAIVYGLSWGLYWGGIAGLAWFAFPELIWLGPSELVTVSFEVVASLIGSSVLIFPLIRLLLHDSKAELGAELAQRSLEREHKSMSLAPRIVVLAVGMALTPVTWQFGTTWLVLTDGSRSLARMEIGHSAATAAHVLGEASSAEEVALALGEDFELFLPGEEPAFATGEKGPEITEHDGSRVILDKRARIVKAAAPVGDGRWVAGEAPVEIESQSFWIGGAALIAAVLGWVFVAAGGMIQLLAGPLARLDEAVRRIIDVGDLRAFGRMPVAYEDEVGGLTAQFNRMLDLFDELADGANAIAAGDLRVQITGRGDLQDAFRAMVMRLDDLISRVRAAAVELSVATTQLHGAASEQEQSAELQAEGVREASATMQRLAESASEVALNAGEVLSNAEQARGRTLVVGDKVNELGVKVARIGELLELIRGIADRSDLLALNGSLEATRAGEAGRGFALVANEMRRLAERVTITVSDVRETIAGIEAANAATVSENLASRELSGNTSEAALRIVEATRIQSAQTEQVSASVREIAAVLPRTVSTSAQTRAAADALRQQAEALEHMTRGIEVESGS